MELQKLKELAHVAINCVNKSQLSERLGLAPAVQVKAHKPILNFPVKYTYLGVNRKGQHVYNLDALEIIRL